MTKVVDGAIKAIRQKGSSARRFGCVDRSDCVVVVKHCVELC